MEGLSNLKSQKDAKTYTILNENVGVINARYIRNKALTFKRVKTTSWM